MQNLKNIFIILIAVGVSSFASFLFQPDYKQNIEEYLSGSLMAINTNFSQIDENFVSMGDDILQVEVEGNKKNEQQDLYMSGLNKRLKGLGAKVYDESYNFNERIKKLEQENKELKEKLSNF